MKIISTCLLMISLFITPAKWYSNFNEAKKEAAKTNKLILLNFSGSDWCSPCIQMKKNIFESDAFAQFAAENLVLANADFPRQKKHKLSTEQKKLNETLAAAYNPDGKFPYTLLLTGGGKVLHKWDGLPELSAQQFVDVIKQHMDENR
ncbi:MAG: thioredoxin family protein [Ginsengibacter sp.]